MAYKSNFNITTLFITKDITVYDSTNNSINFTLHLPVLKDLILKPNWVQFYNFCTDEKVTDGYKIFIDSEENAEITILDVIRLIIFKIGMYDQIRPVYNILLEGLNLLFGEQLIIDRKQNQLKIGNTIITLEIWNYVIYLVKLSYGEKVTLPPTFDSPQAREFYMAQKRAESRISELRSKQERDPDMIIKALLSITYAFPSFDIDYLMEQTMAQIQWLQKYAAESVSYEVNAQAFAAGNMKKGKKLDFFIK